LPHTYFVRSLSLIDISSFYVTDDFLKNKLLRRLEMTTTGNQAPEQEGEEAILNLEQVFMGHVYSVVTE
jgi:hypothetical protein